MADKRLRLAQPRQQQPAQLALPVPLPAQQPAAVTGRRLAVAKPLPKVSVDGACRGEPLALFELGDMVRRWNCAHCPGIIREDGIALHHYDCPYWEEHTGETPF